MFNYYTEVLESEPECLADFAFKMWIMTSAGGQM